MFLKSSIVILSVLILMPFSCFKPKEEIYIPKIGYQNKINNLNIITIPSLENININDKILIKSETKTYIYKVIKKTFIEEENTFKSNHDFATIILKSNQKNSKVIIAINTGIIVKN